MAIALFPLSEGETLGSNFGRYAEYMGLASTVTLRRRLFGYFCDPGTRLPSGVAHLAEQVRDYWNMQAETIIESHTEFRYATMMASPSMREKLLRKMLSLPTSQVARLRISGLKGELVTALRYCEECLAEWGEKKVAPYWKLDHQLAGVYCCVTHSCMLKAVRHAFAKSYVDPTFVRLTHPSDEVILPRISSSEKDAIEDVAKRSARQRASGNTYQPMQTYRDLFRDAGFARRDSALKRDVVISEWLNYFGPEYCQLTNMNERKISTWLDGLSERASAREAPHPFMFIAAESFLEHHVALPGSFAPATRCRSSASSREWGMVVPVFEAPVCGGALHRDTDVLRFAGPLRRSGGWKLVCSCGISYRMLEVSQCGARRVIPFLYGARYHKRFALLMEKGISIRRAARELRLCRQTALNWARREGYTSVETLSPAEIRKSRSKWRHSVENAPSESRITSAARADPAVYKALSRCDHAWLLTFNRKHRSWRPRSSYRVIEPTLDQIREARLELMQIEPPVRATRVAMLEKAGVQRRLNNASKSFLVVLAELVETRETYLERVISWLASLAAEQRLGDYAEAIRQAGLQPRSFTMEQRNRIKEIRLTNVRDS
ncbi:hypothetical protein FAZ95_07855 [Trinickia violacea]|uniref:Uncharacterized protein n=2 Tax=Trinickia violacea TaxID=2571746 RepID=A0A4P8ITD8_9BURK|nr:hypothetical protein FAZ95_07855 [Trinickia violacea]